MVLTLKEKCGLPAAGPPGTATRSTVVVRVGVGGGGRQLSIKLHLAVTSGPPNTPQLAFTPNRRSKETAGATPLKAQRAAQIKGMLCCAFHRGRSQNLDRLRGISLPYCDITKGLIC